MTPPDKASEDAPAIQRELSLAEVRLMALTAARRRIADADLAEDVAQEITEEYHRRRSEIQTPERWIPQAAKRQAARRQGQHLRRGEARDLAAEQDFHAHDEGPVSMASLETNRAATRVALAQLDDADRQILRWRYIDDRSIDDIANQLGIALTAAQKRLQRARKHAEARWGDDIRIILQRR